jgi:hypothetical protein
MTVALLWPRWEQEISSEEKGKEDKDRAVIASDLIVPGYITLAGNNFVYIAEIVTAQNI